MRQTKQRKLILEELSKVNSHPTAAEVYNLVHKRLPKIGLGTVYRNLEIMAQTGIIKKINVAGRQKRFDAITSPHYHVRCTSCGKVDDINMEVDFSLENNAVQKSDYTITGHHVEFEGICRECREKSA